MQKTIIAAAIIGLVSAGASAATLYDKDGTKVSLTGKFDMALQYSTTSDWKGTDAKLELDAKATGVATTPASGLKYTPAVPATNKKLTSVGLVDGKYSRSRLNFKGETKLNDDVSLIMNYDFRFADVFVGKNAATSGGIQDNDAMEGTILSKKYGMFRAGTTSSAIGNFVFKKPYVNKKESEIVKYGVSNIGHESLTNRNMLVTTSQSLPVVAKFSYAFSKESAGQTAAKPPRGNLWSTAIEGSYGPDNMITFGFGTVVKESAVSVSSDRLQHNEGFVSYQKNGFKISLIGSMDKADNTTKEKISGTGAGLNAYYLIGDRLDLGVSLQGYKDTSDAKKRADNSAKGYMYGAHYYYSNELTLFAGASYTGWSKNEELSGAKIAGPTDTFSDKLNKVSGRTMYAGFNYTF